jgi:hypothetical protein
LRISRYLSFAHVVLVALTALPRHAHAQPLSTLPTARLIREVRIDPTVEDLPAVPAGKVGPHYEIALSLRQDAQVRIYGADGRRRATIGRKGDGPGEFRLPQVQGWLGDTLWIYDFMQRRHTFTTAVGALIRTVPLAADRGVARLVNFSPGARAPDGTWVGIATVDTRAATQDPFRGSAIVSVQASGKVTVLASRDPDPRWPVEFTNLPQTAYSPAGTDIVAIGVTDLKPAGEFLIVSRIKTNGDTIYTTRVPYQGVPMSRAHRDSIIRRGFGIDRTHNVADNRIPPIHAPVYGASMRPDGAVYLTLRTSASDYALVLLDAHGSPRFRIPLGARTKLLASRDDRLWISEEDDDGVQSVSLYRVVCGGKPCP